MKNFPIILAISLLYFSTGLVRSQNATSTGRPSPSMPPSTGRPRNCSRGERPVECRPCDGTCQNPRPICSQVCIPGNFCACQAGFVRFNNACIPVQNCPHNGSTISPPSPSQPPRNITCQPGEQPTSCRPCEGTCQKPNPICPRICIRGNFCRCAPGHVRNSVGRCVNKSQCPPPSLCCNFFHCVVCPPGQHCVQSSPFPFHKHCAPKPPVCNIFCPYGRKCKIINGRPQCVPNNRPDDSRSSAVSDEEV